MSDVLQTVRTTILMAFRAFPLLMIGFIGFLAIGLGNVCLFVLFMGHTLVVPVVTSISQGLFDTYGENTERNLYHVPSSSLGLLVPTSSFTTTSQNVAPSSWMAHSLFFLGYILANAVSLYRLPIDPAIDARLTENRRSKSRTIMVTTLFLAVVLSYLRLGTKAETLRGIMAAFVVGGGFGYLWYQFAVICGASASDVLGMSQQILPSSAKEDAPMTCVYAPKP